MTQPRRILVIDDNKDIHADFRKVFESIRLGDDDLAALEADLFGADEKPSNGAKHVLSDVQIDSAYQGEEGIRMVLDAERQGQPYDMAFVDVRMPPGIDGVQTIKRLWSQVEDLQCVICTAFSDYDWEEILRHLGKAGNLLVLKKPFDPIEVLQLAQSLAEKSDLARAARRYQRKLERQVQELTGAQSELRRNNEQLQAARAEAEAANSAKSDFLANMSHELRTPLNAVIGITDLLLATRLDTQQRKYARMVKSSGETLLDLINEVLDFSKIEAGKLELEQIEFGLRLALEQVLEVAAQKCGEKNLQVACFIDPRIPEILRGDPVRLRQIVTNLTNNAIKFTSQGEIVVRAVVEDETSHEVIVRFTVRDTGIGIPAGRLNRLFRVFSQVDDSTTRKYGGTGLGLAICKQLCEMMGGTIGVDSEPGVGSTFWFRLPLRRAEGGPVSTPLRVLSRQLHVLVVESNAASRDVLQEQIAAWGFSAEAASDERTALEKLRDAAQRGEAFHVALVDVDLADDGAVKLAHAVRTSEELVGTPLVALTSLVAPAQVARLQAAGFAECLTKPVMPSELFNTLTGKVAGGCVVVAVAYTKQPAERALDATARGARLLLAEDNEVNQEVALEILRRAGYQCDVVANGREALEASRQNTYDLILMDCQMPEMSGVEATRQIRDWESADAQSRHIPIVALTANVMEGERQRCLEVGMDEYLTKPLNPLDLIDTIESLLRDAAGGARPPEKQLPQRQEAAAENAASASAAPRRDILDFEALVLRCVGNRPLAIRLLQKFESRCRPDLEILQTHLEAGEFPQIAAVAHSLKGAAANVAAESLRQAFADLEQQAKASDGDGVAATLRGLPGLWDDLHAQAATLDSPAAPSLRPTT